MSNLEEIGFLRHANFPHFLLITGPPRVHSSDECKVSIVLIAHILCTYVHTYSDIVSCLKYASLHVMGISS